MAPGHWEMFLNRCANMTDEAPGSSSTLDANAVNQYINELNQYMSTRGCYTEREETQNAIHRSLRRDMWHAIGQFYEQAVIESTVQEEIESTDLSAQLKRLIFAAKKVVGSIGTSTRRWGKMVRAMRRAKMARELRSVLAVAGQKILQARAEGMLIDTLVDELSTGILDPSDGNSSVLHDGLLEAEATWAGIHVYATFEDKPEQHKFIRAQDCEDRVLMNSGLLRFYICPHCGTYCSSKVWHRELNCWYCRVDWDKWCITADPVDVAKLQSALGKSVVCWPMVGCGRQYKPWAFGQAMLVEYRDYGGQWKCFMADLIPDLLEDAIKSHQAVFTGALAAATPEQVYNLIPRVDPKANPVALAGFDVFPGLGRFDLKRWGEDDQPKLTTVGWLKLALQAFQSNLVKLQPVLETTQSELGTVVISHVPSGKSDAVGDLLMAVTG